jgi:hypothetical protein
MSQINGREAAFSEIMLGARQYLTSSDAQYLSFFNCPYSGKVEMQAFDHMDEEVVLDENDLSEISELGEAHKALLDTECMSVSKDSLVVSRITDEGEAHDVFACFDFTGVDMIHVDECVPEVLPQDLYDLISGNLRVDASTSTSDYLLIQIRLAETSFGVKCLGSIDLRNIENLPADLGSFIDDLDVLCGAVLDIHQSVENDLRTATLSVLEPCEATGKMLRSIKSSHLLPSSMGDARLN